ncbi:hypothetical protein [Niallia taxi]|uniref:hypothetical protein n=1 Tax=Niallia taxi TaxID=2499688 RepID=UPI002E1F0193|nr:hypothetical protein [Niallia taxi]
MKKKSFCCVFLSFFLLSGCSSSMDYILLEEDAIKKLPDVFNYVDELQSTNTKYKGYKIFNASGKEKIVVISSGKDDVTLRVNDASKSSLDTSLTVVKVDEKSGQKNSYIAVKISEIVGAFSVLELDQYEEAS